MGRYTVNGTSYDSWDDVPPAARDALRAVGAGPRDEGGAPPPSSSSVSPPAKGANRYRYLVIALVALIVALALIAVLALT
ncbi:hypothetical protein [Janibacter sp. GXQ6167]|uniref:hypothetical protein n=1 Tax=Janibacter sp. GXQ6167 TaxID=3240791 RepID=UPI00352658D1